MRDFLQAESFPFANEEGFIPIRRILGPRQDERVGFSLASGKLVKVHGFLEQRTRQEESFLYLRVVEEKTNRVE